MRVAVWARRLFRDRVADVLARHAEPEESPRMIRLLDELSWWHDSHLCPTCREGRKAETDDDFETWLDSLTKRGGH